VQGLPVAVIRRENEKCLLDLAQFCHRTDNLCRESVRGPSIKLL
jgi:hypothetical protein